jgi:hypothetical protein
VAGTANGFDARPAGTRLQLLPLLRDARQIRLQFLPPRHRVHLGCLRLVRLEISAERRPGEVRGVFLLIVAPRFRPDTGFLGGHLKIFQTHLNSPTKKG